jgi:hypothetical protein
MNTETTHPKAELLTTASNWVVGGGIITMALAPLAIPIIGLTLIATIPLVLIGVAGALAAAVVALPILLLVKGVQAALTAVAPASTSSSRATISRASSGSSTTSSPAPLSTSRRSQSPLP